MSDKNSLPEERSYLVDVINLKGYRGIGDLTCDFLFSDQIADLRDKGQVYVIDALAEEFFKDEFVREEELDLKERVTWQQSQLGGFSNFPVFKEGNAFFVEFRVDQDIPLKIEQGGCYIYLQDMNCVGAFYFASEQIQNRVVERLETELEEIEDVVSTNSEIENIDDLHKQCWSQLYQSVLLKHFGRSEVKDIMSEALVKELRPEDDLQWKATIVPFFMTAENEARGFDYQFHLFFNEQLKITAGLFPEPLYEVTDWTRYRQDVWNFTNRIVLPSVFGWNSLNSRNQFKKQTRFSMKMDSQGKMRKKRFDHYDVSALDYSLNIKYGPLNAESVE